jgi:hypothetical protein
MQTEIALPNRDGLLLPGAFVQVSLKLAASGALTVPANALLFRGDGNLVAVLDAAGKVSLQKVRLGRNFGDTIEVSAGLKGGERIVLNPSDSLAEGDKVLVAVEPRAAASAAKAAP